MGIFTRFFVMEIVSHYSEWTFGTKNVRKIPFPLQKSEKTSKKITKYEVTSKYLQNMFLKPRILQPSTKYDLVENIFLSKMQNTTFIVVHKKIYVIQTFLKYHCHDSCTVYTFLVVYIKIVTYAL